MFSSEIFRQLFFGHIFEKVENIDILKFITDIENVDPESINRFFICRAPKKYFKVIVQLKKNNIFYSKFDKMYRKRRACR